MTLTTLDRAPEAWPGIEWVKILVGCDECAEVELPVSELVVPTYRDCGCEPDLRTVLLSDELSPEGVAGLLGAEVVCLECGSGINADSSEFGSYPADCWERQGRSKHWQEMVPISARCLVWRGQKLPWGSAQCYDCEKVLEWDQAPRDENDDAWCPECESDCIGPWLGSLLQELDAVILVGGSSRRKPGVIGEYEELAESILGPRPIPIPIARVREAKAACDDAGVQLVAVPGLDFQCDDDRCDAPESDDCESCAGTGVVPFGSDLSTLRLEKP